jgi:hypothetical protein
MKIIITESQHKFLFEQFPEPGDKGFETKKPTKIQQKRSDDASEEGGFKNEPTNVSIQGFYNPKDKHTILTILQIGTAFIPYVGPFISSGIGLYDAKTYYDEGDKKTAGLVGLFSIIPSIGGLARKMGLDKWSAKALSEIAKKISFGKKLLPAEIQVANKVVQYRNLITSEIKKIGENTVTKTVLSKSNQIKNLIKKGINVLTPNELPNKFYHGTGSKLNLNNLNLTSLGKKITNASQEGMYFSENLWDNASHYNEFTNPVYSQGVKSVGSESAEKYAQSYIMKGKNFLPKKGYIYEMELFPDAIIVSENSLKIKMERITSEQAKNLLSQGIDAIYKEGQELVVLNKKAIKSFNLKYTADKFVGKQVKNSFGDSQPIKGSYGYNWKIIN